MFDPESAHSNKFNVYFLRMKYNLKWFFSNKYVYMYFNMLLVFVSIIFMRNIIPEEISYSSETYSDLKNHVPYRIFMENYDSNMSIQPLIYPKKEDVNSYIDFKKNLNQVKNIMKKTMKEENFACFPIYGLGLLYNAIMLQDDQILYINPSILEKNDMENKTLLIHNIFDQKNDAANKTFALETKIEFVTEKNNFEKKTKIFTNINSFCFQNYIL
jgi:hypothetical protein